MVTFVNMELFVLPVLEKMTGSQRYRVEYREGTLAETLLKKTGKSAAVLYGRDGRMER